MRRTAQFLLVLLLGLFLTTGAALGAPERVVDQAGALSESQRTALVNGLTKRAIPYYVHIIEAANGTQNDLADQAQAWYNGQQLPKESVLITIAMKERFVDFRTDLDGPVDQAIMKQTGEGFNAQISQMVEAFKGPAGRGDFTGGVLAVADLVDRLAPSLSSAGAPATAPGTLPSPGPSGSPSPGTPAPSQGSTAPFPPPPTQQPTESIADEPLSPAIPVGLVSVGLLTWWSIAAFRYRKQRRQGLQVRDGYAGDLLNLQNELPLLRRYEGAETRALCDQTGAAIDAALAKHLEGETARESAEGAARFGRMIKSRRTMLAATEAYKAAETLAAIAAEAWRPAAEALRQWDETLPQGQKAQQESAATLQATKSATGWPLGALQNRLDATLQELQRLVQLRETDLVQSYRRLLELIEDLGALQSDTARVQPLHASLQQVQPDAARLGERRQGMQKAHDLRWVEGDPARGIQGALAEQERGLVLLQAGQVAEADGALATAASLLAEAESLLGRYQTAIEALPALEAKVKEQTAGLTPLIQEAGRILTDLNAQYDESDWHDVADLVEVLSQYRSQGVELTGSIPAWRSPSVQQLLTAHDQSVAFLGTWAPLEERLNQLRARPAELERIARQAAEAQARLADELARCDEVIVRENLMLTEILADRMEALRKRLAEVERLATSQPRPVRAWLEQANQAAQQAHVLQDDIEQLGYQAQQARAALIQIQARLGSAGRYHRYDRGGWASQMDASLRAAEHALALGLYHEVMQHAHEADTFHAALEQEFHRQQEEEERARRAQEEAAASSSSTSGGGGSFDSSSSDNNTTGGGGSW